MSKFDKYCKLLFHQQAAQQQQQPQPSPKAFNIQLQAPHSPGSPVNGDKSKKNFYSRLNKLVEDNMRLKTEQQRLKEINK